MERAPASPLAGTPSWTTSTARSIALSSALLGLPGRAAAADPGIPSAVPGRDPAVATDSVHRVAPTIPDSAAVAALPVARDPGEVSGSLHWAVGVGAPTFPQRDRFRLETASRATRDSLSIDQPWDGSQLGFSTALEAAVRWRFLRPVVGAQWSFWDSRAVLRDPRSGELLERTWRVDQLVGQAGFDALVPKALLTIANARAPYVGWRAAYGVGRLEGLGRAWARGGGWQAHVGADVWSFGPFELGGRFGWSSLSMESPSAFSRVLYEGQGSEELGWNGSGIWLDMVLRLDSRRRAPDVAAKPAAKIRQP